MYILISTSPQLQCSIAFIYEWWEPITGMSAVPVALSLRKITVIFISYYTCCQYLELSFFTRHFLKFMLVVGLTAGFYSVP